MIERLKIFLLVIQIAGFPILSVNAQGNIHKGMLSDLNTRKPVSLAHVQNVSRRLSVLSDTTGLFQIPAAAGDTLVFSAIGYHYTYAVVKDCLSAKGPAVCYKMESRIYEISEVRVYAFGNYQQFKQQFLDLDLSKNKTELLRRSIASQSLQAAREADQKRKEQKMSEGMTLMSVPILTPEEKQRLKLKEVQKTEHRKSQVYEKFNPLLVKKITGISGDEEVLEFMLFCNFSDEFVINTGNYELMVIIARKYETFVRRKQGKAADDEGKLPRSFGLSGSSETC